MLRNLEIPAANAPAGLKFTLGYCRGGMAAIESGVGHRGSEGSLWLETCVGCFDFKFDLRNTPSQEA